jgi:hypothetical protein
MAGLSATVAQQHRPRRLAPSFDSEPDARGKIKVDAFVHGAGGGSGSP